MSRDDDSVLSRWSRRKHAVAAKQRDKTPDQPSARPTQAVEGQAAAAADLSEAELLEKLGLPDPDTLQQGDDFSGFMAKAVPAALRRRALRRLWTSNPLLANLDGLIDHGEDYTDAATVPEVFRTAYRVGEGFLREALKEPPAAPEPENEEIVNPAVDNADDSPDIAAQAGEGTESEANDPEQSTPRPRRMTFRAG